MNERLKMDVPTDEQIDLVEKIVESLSLDFPTSSYDFNYDNYNTFIKEYGEKYLSKVRLLKG